MEAIALLTALLALAAALLKIQTERAPARKQEQLEADYDRDVERADFAIASGADGGADISALFEANRQDAVRRGAVDPRPFGGQSGGPGPGSGVVRDLPNPAGSADGAGGGPADRPAA